MLSTFPVGIISDISNFLSSQINVESGKDLYPDVFEAGTFFPLQRREEMRKMIQEARTINPKIIYEIGSDKGGSLYHWCKCFPEVQRVIACEIRGTPFNRLFEQYFPKIDFCWLERSSYSGETIRQVRRWLGEDKIDVLFIDGDKSFFDLDFTSYLPFMRSDGIVFLHDVNEPGNSRDTFNHLKRTYFTKEIVDISDTIAELKRRDDNLPPRNAYEDWLRFWEGRSCGVGVVYLGKKV